jgi:hypothetical protein
MTAGVFVAQNRRTPFAQSLMHLAARLGSPRDPAAPAAGSSFATGGPMGRLGAFLRRR